MWSSPERLSPTSKSSNFDFSDDDNDHVYRLTNHHPDPPVTFEPFLTQEENQVNQQVEEEEEEEEEEDEIVALARAAALQAQQEIAKKHKSKQNPFLAVIEKNANNIKNLHLHSGGGNGNNTTTTTGGGGGAVDGNNTLSSDHHPNNNSSSISSGGSNTGSNQVILGDLQQRKLIEEKLGSHVLSNNYHHNHHNEKHVAEKNVKNTMKDVKEKFEHFFQHQHQHQQQQPQSGQGQPPQNDTSLNKPNTDKSSLTAPLEQTTLTKPKLSTIVWKRRSGYGKYSMNAWEKRRMELVDSKIIYYKCFTEEEGDTSTQQHHDREVESDNLDILSGSSSMEQQSKSELNSPSRSTTRTSITTATSDISSKSIDNHEHNNTNNNENNNNNNNNNNTTTTPSTSKFLKKEFWEQTKQNITKSINEVSINTANMMNINNQHNDDDPNVPRGTMDLLQDNISIAAISDHEKSLTSVSPTPYGLCIENKSDQKRWKVCFESHRDQTRWLIVLTEIVVKKSVDLYNKELSSQVLSPKRTTSNTNNQLEHFRPAPTRKDGLWYVNEKFSSSRLLLDDEDDEDISYDESSCNSVAMSETESKSVKKTKEKKMKPIETPIISDLPPPIVDLILNGAKSGHGYFLKNYNLDFVVAVMNVSLMWVYFSPMYWLLFPFFLITINSIVLGAIMESKSASKEDYNNDDEQNKRLPLTVVKNIYCRLLSSSNGSNDTANLKRLNKSSASVSPEKTHEKVMVNTFGSKKPVAGTTTIRLSDPTDSNVVNDHTFISWIPHSPQDVQVRSHGYMKTKKKIPSPSSLYEVTNMEVFDSYMRVSEVATKVVIPTVNFDDGGEERRWKSPDTFIVSLALPTEEPSFTKPTEDGFGFTTTIYYKMKKETREILKRITAPDYNPANDDTEANVDVQKRVVNGVRLWEEWCQKAPTDADWQARFKLIPNVLNPVEVGLPSWIAKYCGKPVLIKRKGKTGFLSTHSELNAFEFDISLHVFPYLAKKAMAYIRSSVCKKALISLSYVVEARSDDELPEIVIGDPVKILYPDPDLFINANDFFSGTAPKSLKLD